MLSRSIVENIELARRASQEDQAALPGEVAPGTPEFSGEPDLVEAGGGQGGATLAGEGQATADLWTGALMVAVVVLAVTLGWMVGRGGRGSRGNAVRQGNVGLQANAAAARAETAVSPAVTLPATATSSRAGAGSGLVVYQNGRIVFPQTPPTRETQPRDSTTAAASVQPAVDTSKVQTAGPVRIPPEVAAGWVTQRVEPEYPEHARAGRVQGAVVLDALVGRDGAVEKFGAIRGDPELAAAASAAVRQWRFKPLARDGQSEDFQTQITVVFRLP